MPRVFYHGMGLRVECKATLSARYTQMSAESKHDLDLVEQLSEEQNSPVLCWFVFDAFNQRIEHERMNTNRAPAQFSIVRT